LGGTYRFIPYFTQDEPHIEETRKIEPDAVFWVETMAERFSDGVVLASFHPETVLFRPGGVNLRNCLCGVPMYASAQSLYFLASTKNSSFL